MSTAPKEAQILDIEPDDEMEQHIREGFSHQSLDALQRFLDVSQAELAQALGVSRQTVIRNKKKRGSHLSAQMSDQLYRVARLTRRAVEVIGSREGGVAWLKRPNAALGGHRPLGLLDTDAGCQKVSDVLGRIEHGVHS